MWSNLSQPKCLWIHVDGSLDSCGVCEGSPGDASWDSSRAGGAFLVMTVVWILLLSVVRLLVATVVWICMDSFPTRYLLGHLPWVETLSKFLSQKVLSSIS